MAGPKTASPSRAAKAVGATAARTATSAQAIVAAEAAPVPAAEDAARPAIEAAKTMTDQADAVAADAIDTVAHAAAATIDTVEETVSAAKPTVAPSRFFDLMKGLTMATAFDTTKANAALGEMNEKAKGAMEKGAMFAQDFQDFAKGNVEALVASGRVAAKGVEEMAQYSADYSRKTVEQATAAMKSFAGAKSPTEFFQLQSDYAKTAVDAMVAETSKFTESYIKLIGDIAQPLTSRYAVAAEKIKAVAA